MIFTQNTLRKSSKSICLGAAIILSAGTLSSCGDDKEEPTTTSSSETAAAKATDAPVAKKAPEVVEISPEQKITAAKQALFEILLYDTADTIAELARHPELQVPSQLLLEKLQSYYDVIAEQESQKIESARVALTIAKTCSSLRAIKRAETNYQLALDSLLSLTDDEKNSDIKRLMSIAYNGLAFSKFSQQDVASALELYKKQLIINEELFALVAPAEGAAPPVNDWSDEIALASSNLLGAYRCFGDALSANDELEDARDTYRKGIKHASMLNKLSQNMTMQYIKLLTAMGNLESRCGKEKEALQAWATAAQLAQKINERSQDASIKFESKRNYDALLPLLKSISAKLKAQEAALKADAAPAAQ